MITRGGNIYRQNGPKEFFVAGSRKEINKAA